MTQMNTPIPYTLTNESITVVVSGSARTEQKGTVLYNQLRAACLAEDWNAVGKLVTPSDAILKWFGSTNFTIDMNSKVCLGTEALPEVFQARMRQMANKGENPIAVANFFERLQRNPSARSVSQLFSFLEHIGIPLTEDGHFLAYKGVDEDLKDQHSHKVDNSPGVVNEMPRNKISDDPREACHFGFHVGALSYASGFGPRTVICKVDPADVVCVPYDESWRKMRVCKYEVVGHHVADGPTEEKLPDSVTEVDTEGELDEDPNEEYVDEEADFRVITEKETPKTPRRGKSKAFFATMNTRDLMNQTIDDLRAYATKGLKIVGASKLPGGKSSLVARIVRIRKKEKAK